MAGHDDLYNLHTTESEIPDIATQLVKAYPNINPMHLVIATISCELLWADSISSLRRMGNSPTVKDYKDVLRIIKIVIEKLEERVDSYLDENKED